MNKLKSTRYIFRFLFYFFLTYGMFYHSYKFSTPDLGNNDFYSYYKIAEKPFDLSVEYSPYIYRQFTPLLVNIIYSLNIYYDAEISYQNENIDQRLYFAFLLANYIGILFTALIISYIIQKITKNESLLLTLGSGMVFFLSWSTSLWGISGLTESWSWFFVGLAYLALRTNNSRFFLVTILISAFQKESILILLSIITLSYFLLTFINGGSINRMSYLKMFAFSFLTFLVYIAIRKFVLPVPGKYEYQLEIQTWIKNLLQFRISKRILFQTILAQSPIYVFLLLSLYAKVIGKSLKFMMEDTLPIVISFFILYLVGISTGLGTNTGRIVLMLIPIWTVLSFQLLHGVVRKDLQ